METDSQIALSGVRLQAPCGHARLVPGTAVLVRDQTLGGSLGGGRRPALVTDRDLQIPAGVVRRVPAGSFGLHMEMQDLPRDGRVRLFAHHLKDVPVSPL